jgi:hypothetical protein
MPPQLPSSGIVEMDAGRLVVLGQMLAGPGTGNKQDIGREVQQPGEGDLGRGRTEAPSQLDQNGAHEDRVLDAPRPAQRAVPGTAPPSVPDGSRNAGA